MCNGTGHLDTQQACNAEQEAEYACDNAAPEEHRAVPLPPVHQLEESAIFTLNQDEWRQEQRGT